MATAVDCGHANLREVQGVCDWCGDDCHPNAEICTAISCQRCDTALYHQACIEKFLKKYGFPTSRKCGFPCPRGKGKGAKAEVECKGKVERSHPIVPKNEEKKKARLAPQVLEAMAKPGKTPKEQHKAAAKEAAAAKPAAKLPAMPRKLAPPKPYLLPQSVASPRVVHHTPAAAVNNAWAQRGAAPVLANAHLPDPEPEEEPVKAEGPRPAQLPVGLVLEEALSKAQKKNLARRKKRQVAAAMEKVSEASADTAADVADDADATSAMSDPAAAMAAGAGALSGFDGGPVDHSPHPLLEQQGHKFINNIEQYQRLLGLYMGDDSDEESDAEESDTGEAEHAAVAAAFVTADEAQATTATGLPDVGHSSSSGMHTQIPPAAAAMNSPPQQHTPAAAAPPAAAGAPAPAAGPAALPHKDTTVETEDVALEAALAASVRQYELEQEIARQRELLAAGSFGAAGPVKVAAAPPAAPVATPIAVVPASPAPVPPAAPAATASLLYSHTKQQPEPLGTTQAHYSSGWVFGGGEQGYVPPHAAAYGSHVGFTTPGQAHYGTGGLYGNMAAGHTTPEVVGTAAAEEEDDLSSLLALCGVAG